MINANKLKGVNTDTKWDEELDQYLDNFTGNHDDGIQLKSNIARLHNVMPNEYQLHVCSIEYHLAAEQNLHRNEPRYFVTFGELGDYLSSAIPTTLKSRLVIFAHNVGRSDQGNRQAELQAPVAAKLASLLGQVYGIDHNVVVRLGGQSKDLSETTHEEKARNPFDARNVGFCQPTEEASIPLLQTMATTRRLSEYESDNMVFTFSYHTKPPMKESITLFYDNRVRDSEGYWRGILACSTTDIMDRLVHSFTEAPSEDQDLIFEGYDPRILQQHADKAILSYTRANTANIESILSKIQYIARREPSHFKLDYILHLQDHLATIWWITNQTALRNDTEWSKCSPQHDNQKWAETFSRENAELCQTVSDLRARAKSVYDISKDQIAGRDSARNKLFAALAAIYLPFSLATGVLGMNIREFTGHGPRWWVCVVLGFPLALVTVALPLRIEAIDRGLQQLARRRPRTCWALVVLLPILVVCTLAIVVVVALVFVNR